MKKISKFLIALILTTGALSCKKSFLDESSRAFLTESNAFLTVSDYDNAVNSLYNRVRSEYFNSNDFAPFDYIYRTDAYFNISTGTPNPVSDFNPVTGFATGKWTPNFRIVAEANTIIGRVKESSLSPAQKTLVEAKARFFRAFGYRTLVYLYGGVPLVLEEVTTPKTDFVRATKQQCLAQIIEDFKFAAANLPGIGAVRAGEVSNLVANHYLAETYISNAQYQLAVDATSIVINDPATDLMTTRFGNKSTVVPGDPYWDLFQVGNQNATANREKLWVIQFETDVLGGGASTTAGSQTGVYGLERVHAPLMRDFRIGNDQPFAWPVGDYTGGRGVGFLAPNEHYITTIWQSDYNNDMRNKNNNLVRDFVGTNPASAWFGKTISTSNYPAGSRSLVDQQNLVNNKPNRAIYPYQSKATTPFSHPAAMYNTASPIPFLLKDGAGGTYRDEYMLRLAETYLIRAEAYMKLNNLPLAAADINIVRARSNANPVLPAAINIDYILDERLREFGVEEKRMITLMRLGLYVDRVSRFNPRYSPVIATYNLWPIPQAEIERNNTAKLEQNPGYNL
jgi:starch-binding outer membrane protein, SusD/RagB family